MKYNRKKISKIVDELSTFCFSVGALEMNVNIKRDQNKYTITLTSNFLDEDIHKVEKLESLLNPVDKNIGFAGAYWELVGESNPYDEIQLSLVGQMVDDAHISIVGDKLTLVLHISF